MGNILIELDNKHNVDVIFSTTGVDRFHVFEAILEIGQELECEIFKEERLIYHYTESKERNRHIAKRAIFQNLHRLLNNLRVSEEKDGL